MEAGLSLCRHQHHDEVYMKTGISLLNVSFSERSVNAAIFCNASRILAIIVVSGRPSVCPSAHPSVALLSPIKMVQDRIAKSSL